MLKTIEKVRYCTFPILENAGVKHGFSTRIGGVSEGYFSSMNLGFKTGDDRERVMRNHQLFARAVGYDETKLVLTDQIHETVVRRVTASDAGKGIIKESDITGVDGLITNDPAVVLMIFSADCVPLFFYDKRNHAIGASHSGWRGTVKKMGKVTIERMHEEFGTVPEDVLAVIGPSICQKCYEVGRDVIREFEKSFDECDWKDIFYRKEGGEEKYQLDLWRANEMVLRQAGVPESQIEGSGFCTCCHPEILFSHRASHGKRGSLAGVITLG